jgi:ubiquinone/menaquinone biosynthesis C-methylase UbiE
MTTRLALAYACALEVVHRARLPMTGGRALDLACGPGHYTLCLARYLGYETVTGIDLSNRMIEAARQNGARAGVDGRVRFHQGDVTRLDGIPTASVDLASFTNGAHHLPELQAVTRVLREMDRVTKPKGLIMVMDLVRLPTAGVTERYVATVGQDYREQGLSEFFADFRHSMYAAWTTAELRQAVPANTNRSWWQIVPWGLPMLQILLGLPRGCRTVFRRSGLPWRRDQGPVPAGMGAEWTLLRWALALGSWRRITPC